MQSKQKTITLTETNRISLIYLLDFLKKHLTYQDSVKGFCLDVDFFKVKRTTLFLNPEQLNEMQDLLKEIS